MTEPLPETPGARILDSPAPIACCVPGVLSSITVFSAGLIARLDEQELRAVIEHEKAHVTQRHDVVLVLFRAWYASLPWFPIASRAQHQVGLLIEMLADDRARAHVDDSVLARAIVPVGAGADRPLESGGITVAEVAGRVSRLGRQPLPGGLEAAIAVGAVALLAVPTGLLVGPALLHLLA